MQSNEEIYRIVQDWEELGYAPKNLIKTPAVASLLVEWVLANNNNVVSFAGLNRAVTALGSQVLTPELTPAEVQAAAEKKAEERMLRDFRESIKPQPAFEEQRVKAEKAQREAKAEEKRQKVAQSQIITLIDSYSINLGPGRLDHARAEYFRGQLRQIKVTKNGKYDAILTLKKVQEALSKLP